MTINLLFKMNKTVSNKKVSSFEDLLPIRYLHLGEIIEGLIRPKVSLKTLILKWDPHFFNIRKLKCNDMKLLIVD